MKKTTVSVLVDCAIAKRQKDYAASLDFDYDAAVKRINDYADRTRDQYRRWLQVKGGA